MAFNLDNLYILTLPANNNVLPMYSYVTTDTIATVKAANYFVGIQAYVGTSISCKASDGVANMLINTLTNNQEGIATAVTTVSAQSLTFDQITASALTTSLSAFNAAAAGIAVSVTQTEYAALFALVGAVKSGCGDSGINEGSSGGADAVDNTDGFWGSWTTIPTNKTIYAFAIQLGAATNFQLKVGSVPSSLTNMHTNIVTGADGARYFVIKTPSFVTTSVSQVAGFNSAGTKYGNFGDSPSYRGTGNTNNINTLVSGNNQKRYQAISR